MKANIKRSTLTEHTYETDKMRLQVFTNGMARIIKLQGTTAPIILTVTELVDLYDLIEASIEERKGT
jgi:hypothetical protein